jgi:hypothetical protein
MSLNLNSSVSLTHVDIEAIVQHARMQRAEAMHSALVQLRGLVKRLAARLHFGHGPQAGALVH